MRNHKTAAEYALWHQRMAEAWGDIDHIKELFASGVKPNGGTYSATDLAHLYRVSVGHIRTILSYRDGDVT